MFRPVTMSHASIIFLKSDSESVTGILNEHGAFHLKLKEVEGSGSIEHADKVLELSNRLKDVLNRAIVLRGPKTGAGAAYQDTHISYPDWLTFIGTVEKEVSDYEHKIIDLESKVLSEQRQRPVLNMWKTLVSEIQSEAGPGLLPLFTKHKTLFFITFRTIPNDLESVLPANSIVAHASASRSMFVVVCKPEDEAKVTHAAEEAEFHAMEPLENMPTDFAEMPAFLASYEKAMDAQFVFNAEETKSIENIIPRLSFLDASLSDAYSVLNIKGRSSYQNKWAVIEGYVPSKMTPSLSAALNTRLNGRLIPFMKEEHSSPNVPVTYRYPRFFKIFDSITNLYGMPSYNEINPTPILAITFPFFFGLMFGDLGHGLALAALGLVMYKKVASMKKIGIILMISGVAGALVGTFIYGEIFGQSLLQYTGFHALLAKPEEEAALLPYFLQILKIALFVGIGQISLGLGLTIVNSMIQRKWVNAALVNLPKLLLYWGIMYVVWTTKLQLMQWFTGPIYYIITPLLFFVLASPIYAFIKHGRKEGLSHLGENGFDLFETGISFISNTVSYLRIFAMVIAHIELIAAFYALASMASASSMGIVLSPILIVIGNIFVVLLEGIVVLAQDLRLHFYEWFSKFYEDSGVRFAPFKLILGVPITKK